MKVKGGDKKEERREEMRRHRIKGGEGKRVELKIIARRPWQPSFLAQFQLASSGNLMLGVTGCMLWHTGDVLLAKHASIAYYDGKRPVWDVRGCRWKAAAASLGKSELAIVAAHAQTRNFRVK